MSMFYVNSESDGRSVNIVSFLTDLVSCLHRIQYTQYMHNIYKNVGSDWIQCKKNKQILFYAVEMTVISVEILWNQFKTTTMLLQN